MCYLLLLHVYMSILHTFFCDNIIYIMYKSLMLQCSYNYICVYRIQMILLEKSKYLVVMTAFKV
jgi:hypothetical protein